MKTNSLFLRLIISSALISLALLLSADLWLGNLFQTALERNFDARLHAVLDGLLAKTELNEHGQLSMLGTIADTRFTLPLSGWYWQISELPIQPATSLASQSLLEKYLVPKSISLSQRDEEGLARFYLYDAKGVQLRAIEQRFTLFGSTNKFSFLVAGNYDELKEEVQAFRHGLILILSTLGAGLLGAIFFQVRFSLRPMQIMQSNLSAIRQGKAERLEGRFPSEMQPLADELNLLISANSEVIGRARTQVGNLAHALKTPLSILLNEVRGHKGEVAKKAALQAEIMREQINLYLDRARRAAQAHSSGAVTEIKPVLQALERTLAKIYHDRALSVTIACQDALKFRGETQDCEEMIGNLMENSYKWAKSRITIAVTRISAIDNDSGDWALFVLEDDGPGLAPGKRQEALKRGQRLDERRPDERIPGFGLGLSIVRETAHMYNAELILATARLGGLRVELKLPAVTA